jgi:hypothetical protein
MLVKKLLFNKIKNKSNSKKNNNNNNIKKNISNKSITLSSSTLLTVNKIRKRTGGCGCGKK